MSAILEIQSEYRISEKPEQLKIYKSSEDTDNKTLASFLLGKLPSSSTLLYPTRLSEITEVYTNAAGHVLLNGKFYNEEQRGINAVNHLSVLRFNFQQLIGKTFQDIFESKYQIIEIYQPPKEQVEIQRPDGKTEKVWRDNQRLEMLIRLSDGREKRVCFANHLENVLAEK